MRKKKSISLAVRLANGLPSYSSNCVAYFTSTLRRLRMYIVMSRITIFTLTHLMQMWLTGVWTKAGVVVSGGLRKMEWW